MLYFSEVRHILQCINEILNANGFTSHTHNTDARGSESTLYVGMGLFAKFAHVTVYRDASVVVHAMYGDETDGFNSRLSKRFELSDPECFDNIVKYLTEYHKRLLIGLGS